MKRCKLILLLSLVAVLAVVAAAFIACDDNDKPPVNTDKDITGITFSGATVDYDGQEHVIEINGTLPEGTSVSYENNKGTDTGTYNAKATVSGEGYNTLTLTATLTINGATIGGITFSGATVDYDGQEHEILISGSLPQGTSVSYTSNKGINAGVYNATAAISGKGYNTLTLNATLTVNKINYDMSAAAWDYTYAYTYDGEPKTVTLTGLPTGVTVKSYADNSKTNAGDYTATAALSYDEVNYNAPQVANCSWTINKADIIAEMPNDTVEYDSLPHCIQVIGNIPAAATVTYYYNEAQVDDVTEVGEYNVKCEIKGGQNYNNKTLTATFKITSTEERLYSVVTSNGSIYFQNNLDDNRMYKVNSSGISKINNDVPNYMIANGNNVYYFSKGLLSSVIKNYDGTTASALYSTKGEYLTTDGTNIYYAINNMLFNTDQNGIYKLKLDGTDEAPTKLVADKAEYLTYVNGYIYYSNKSDGGKLYRVSVNADNSQGTQLRSDKKDEKVAYIITDGASLYFNSTKTAIAGIGIAAAVCKYNIASGNEVKLTTDSGKYLTKIGSYIYYVNNDKITSNLFGDGIYKVSALETSDNNSVGTKVLSTENNGYSSLTSDGTYLYYYKLSDKHFYRNTSDGTNEVDLMASFEVVDDAALTGYSKIAEYKGEIYFNNPLDNGCLYKYNPTTRARYKVLADSVSSLAFYSYEGNNYMYYCAYVLTNYALFRTNMGTGETVKISPHRYDNFIFEGDKIYCLRITGGNNDIVSMNLDGADEQKIYEGNNDSPDTTQLYKIGNTFYFVMNPSAGFRNVSTFTIGDKNKVNLHKSFDFVIVNNKIYYYADVTDNSTFISQKKENALKVCDMDGKNAQTLVSDVDITYMFAANGKIYFSSKSSQYTGLYEYDIATSKLTQISDKSAHGMTMVGGKLYFLQSQVTYTDDYPAQSQSCDGHLYCYDGEQVTRVA